MELNQIIAAMQKAVQASMAVVQGAQRSHANAQLGIEQKSDGTIVTNVDKASERAALACLEGIVVQAEEGGLIRGMMGIKDSRYSVRLDPLDGTAPFTNGASTSTVIAALYDQEEQVVAGVIVGEPATGRIWETFPDTPTKTRVWQGEMGPKTVVYTDFYPNFTRKGCRALDNTEQGNLFSRLFGSAMVHMMGSNGLHHALVANGGQNVAGAITTAIGGPWDVAPVKLVLDAGGDARAFSRPEERNGPAWIERDPLAIDSYDFLITGNSKATVDKLSNMLTTLPNLR